MLTEASFMTTGPHVFEAEPAMIMPGIACAEFEDCDSGSPFLTLMMSSSPG
jgi:hypothetical protein